MDLRSAITFFIFAGSVGMAYGANTVVVDSISHNVLPGASVYDRKGRAIGVSDAGGVLPSFSKESYPITVKYLGYGEKMVNEVGTDTIFMTESAFDLPEMLVESRRRKMLHILAYVRDFSKMATYSDTVFLFREKVVDYMLPHDRKAKFRGWSMPRVLASKSYYRFTDGNGLDSVSDASSYHFSWSDWMGLAPNMEITTGLRNINSGTDTINGTYSPTEIWLRDEDNIKVEVDILADKKSCKWVPNFDVFFRSDLDFERFKVSYNYENISGDSVTPLNVAGYSYSIESNGRGHYMSGDNGLNESAFVSTDGEIFILDKEYITIKEAKKWEKRDFDKSLIGIHAPINAPELSPSVNDLIARVNAIDKAAVRLNFIPDHRLGSGKVRNNDYFNIGKRALMLLKQLTGITLYKSHKNFNKKWDSFSNDQKEARKRNGCDHRD